MIPSTKPGLHSQTELTGRDSQLLTSPAKTFHDSALSEIGQILLGHRGKRPVEPQHTKQENSSKCNTNRL